MAEDESPPSKEEKAENPTIVGAKKDKVEQVIAPPFYTRRYNPVFSNVKKRCWNFGLLEEKCKEYEEIDK